MWHESRTGYVARGAVSTCARGTTGKPAWSANRGGDQAVGGGWKTDAGR
jgi:hypothetical protein